MLNVRDLERRWNYYNIRRYYPYLFTAVALLVLIIGSTLYYKSSNTTQKTVSLPAQQTVEAQNTVVANLHVNIPTGTSQKKSTPIESVPSSSKVAAIATEKTVEKPIQTQESTIYQPQKLKPSFSFMQNISRSETKAIKTQPTQRVVNAAIVPATPENSQAESKVQTKTEPKKENLPLQTTPLNTPSEIKIDRTKTQQEIQDITQRFETSKNPALGLYLARYHYKMQNYKKSYNYALSTNNIDPNIEEGWLIFASSQVKLGQKDDAIKTLSAYIKSTDSMNAKSLLHSIKNGNFK
jgi:tetratricopeptide (TPR) repeat protein